MISTVVAVCSLHIGAAGADLGSCGELGPGQELTSPDGHYRTVVRPDGNVVTMVGDRVLWSLGTSSPGARLTMRCDGDLVLVAADDTLVWSSGTAGHPGAYLAMQTDANLTVISPDGTARWASGGVNTRLEPGELLRAGQLIQSPQRHFTLVLRPDGDVDVVDRAGAAVWSSGTGGPARHDSTLEMQSDGNLVLYAPRHIPAWATGTDSGANAGAVLEGSDDGVFALRSPSGEIVWQTSEPPRRPTTTTSTTAPSSTSPTTSTTSTSGPTGSPGHETTTVVSATSPPARRLPTSGGGSGIATPRAEPVGAGRLARTGTNVGWLLAAGMALMGMGATMVHLSRRRGEAR